jgi:uncharacterized membrane protein
MTTRSALMKIGEASKARRSWASIPRAVGGMVLLLINLMLICAAGLLTIAAVHLDDLE